MTDGKQREKGGDAHASVSEGGRKMGRQRERGGGYTHTHTHSLSQMHVYAGVRGLFSGFKVTFGRNMLYNIVQAGDKSQAECFFKNKYTRWLRSDSPPPTPPPFCFSLSVE